MDNWNKVKWIIGILQAIEKIKIVGAVLELPASSAYSPRKWAKWPELVVLFSWQLQKGSHNFVFSIAMGADYSFVQNCYA